jgi:hypothetical protein
MMRASVWWIIPVAVLVAACAAPRDEGEPSPLERHMAYAGPPIDRFNYPQRLRGWSPIDREHLLVHTGPGRSYLLAVAPGCIGLHTAHSIGIVSRVGQRAVTSGLDEVRVGQDRCRIVEIRPFDYERMRADGRSGRDELREATLDEE